MRCVEELAALALRHFLVDSLQPVGAGERCASGEDALVRLGPTKVANAMRRALAGTWLAVEIVLAGEGFWQRLESTFGAEGENVYKPLRRFLAAVSADREDGPGSETLRASWLALREALNAALLNVSDPSLRELVGRPNGGIAPVTLEELSEKEREDLDRVGEELEQAGHGNLRPILELRWQERDPLVIVLLAAFFGAGVETDLESAQDATFASADRPAELSSEDFRELAEVLENYRAEISELLETFWSTRTAPDVKMVAARFQRGLAYLQRGEHERAIAEFTRVLRFDRSFADAFACRAEAHRLNGDYKCARADYDAAHHLDPANGRVLLNRGLVQWVLGDYDAAIADYTAALQFGACNALAYLNRGIAHVGRGDDEAALSDFNQALGLDPSYPSAYQKRGDIYFRKGDVDRAIADYSQVFRFNPYCALTYVKRGDAQRANGDFERAIADYSSAVQFDPLNVAPLAQRGLAYRQLERYDLAVADFSSALKLEGENCDLRYQRALTHRTRRDFRAALADFDMALQLRPGDPELVYERGCTHQLRGDLDKALKDFDAAVALKSDFALAHKNKGAIHLSRNEVDQAIAEFGAAIQADPNLVRAYLKRASAWTKKGRLDEAIRDCAQALQRDANLAAAYLVRGSALAQQGAFEAADADFSRALELDSDKEHVHIARGVTAMKQGDFEKALAEFTNSLRLNPGNARTLFLRGTVYQSLEQHDRALADLNQAVLRDPQYTPAYCNQRGLLHAANHRYELALAEFAIVLQLDRTNLTALIGREQALQALKSEPPQASEPAFGNGSTAPPESTLLAPATPRANQPRPRTAKLPPAPHTHEYAVGKATDTHKPVVDQPTELESVAIVPATEIVTVRQSDLSRADQIAMTLLAEDATPAPATSSETRPDRAVAPPSVVISSADTLLESSPGAGAKPLEGAKSPVLARIVTGHRHREESERARLWAQMRHRERQDEIDRQEEEKQLETAPDGRGRALRPLGLIAAVVVLLAAGGAYYAIFIVKSEAHLTAENAWEEFANDTPGASQKYKGKFVQLTGKVKTRSEENANHLFFEAPENAKWGIEFTLPAAKAKELKEGQEITIRCRFGTRKEPDGDLLLSNCTLLEGK